MKVFYYINQLQFSIVMRTALSYNLLYFVCQLDALRRYVLLLFYRDKLLVETAKFNRTFCFGDEVKVKTIKAVKFPVTFGSIKSIKAYLEADIIKNDLPLLLSHKSMKSAGILPNF